MKMRKRGKPVSPAQITKLERLLKIQLPQQYRSFLLEYNGGRPELEGFRYYSRYPGNWSNNPYEAMDSMIHCLYGINEEPWMNLRRYIRFYKKRIPSNMIPVGRDPGGNQICLGIIGPDRGKVFFWFHEDEVEEGEIPDYRNVDYVADDFKTFLESLYPVES